MAMDRRRFLQLSAASVLVATTGTACRGDDIDQGTLARPAVLALLGPVRVREIGVRYRQTVPAERAAPALRAALANDGDALRLPWSKRQSLAERISSDFAAGRTVVVNGWLLSTTEARQCALFSLLPA